MPGDQAGKIEKSRSAGSDCVILDLEDGVAESKKESGRNNIRQALEQTWPGSPVVLVRINSDRAHLRADIRAAVHPGVLGIMLPKCGVANDIVTVAQELAEAEQAVGMAQGTVKLFLLIESARGLLELPLLARVSDRVAALVFGAEDWCLDMGIVRTKVGTELEIARWNIAICARAHGLTAIDTVYTDFNDTDGLLQDTQNSRRMGFSGKLAIHPKQIEPIHSVFAPTQLEIIEAEKIVAAFDQAEGQETGAIAVNGRMVDKPIAERARQVLERARNTK